MIHFFLCHFKISNTSREVRLVSQKCLFVGMRGEAFSQDPHSVWYSIYTFGFLPELFNPFKCAKLEISQNTIPIDNS